MTDLLPNSEEFLGHYRLVRKIGSGGMGDVYLAEDTRLGRNAAVKILQPNIANDTQKMSRFMQEAKTASALNHPNIITIYEVGKHNDVNFIATEFIDGETLHEHLDRGALQPKTVIEIAVQIASGLAAAHSAGIVHRDIKPENVMMRPDGLVKILDFGIAKLTEKDDSVDSDAATVAGAYTHPGVIIGTVAYMSPEQARGHEVDAKSDIFSFGTLLYELLTGHQPFAGETPSHTIVAILEDDPPPLHKFIRDYPNELNHLIRHCLEKIPDRRWRTTEVLDRLKMLDRRLEFEALPSQRDASKVTTLEIPNSVGESNKTQPNAAPPNNLTNEITPLIGRETEIRALGELLDDQGVRLITLTGIGGTGKTRLAQAVARRALASFRDGVYFVDLSSIFDPGLVFSTIAARMNIEEARSRPFTELLIENLAERQTLLVIDNFEQVLRAAEGLAEIINACERVKIIVTSRQLLNLSVEKEFAVGPLPAPPPNVEFQNLEEAIKQFPSLGLFEARARNASPGFKLSSANLESVAQVCSHLDGLPLAIELAAARTKVLSAETLALRLVDSLALLSHGPRDLPERQQTMRAAIRWSYDLLDQDERSFFRRMSVFAGSFTAEAAEAICDEGCPAIDLLTSLLEKSLFERTALDIETPRFRMLEVVREFAMEMLKSESEEVQAKAAHARHFLELSEKAEPFIQAAQSPEWLDQIELEHDNLRAAIQWSLENDTVIAGRLATATRNFWLLHSHLSEGFRWLKAAADADRQELPPDARLKLLNALGLIARFLGRLDVTRDAYEEALEAGNRAGDTRGMGVANRGLGLLALQDGRFSEAKVYFETGLSQSREIQDDFGVALSLNYLGDVARTEGENSDARGYFEKALPLLRKLNNKVAVADNLNNLASAALSENDLESSSVHFTEAIKIAHELGNKITVSISLDGFAAIATRRGEYERAAKLAAAADQLRHVIGYEIEPAEKRFRETYISELSRLSNVYSEQIPGEIPEAEEAIQLALS